MLAMLRTMPRTSSSGLRFSLASPSTSSACSTPCSEKYSASVESSAWSAATEGVDGQQAERRRAVDEDEVVAALALAQGVAQGELAAHLAREDQLRLGEPEVGRDHVAVDGVDGLGLAGEHLAERRLRGRVGVEVVGEVALRVGVDGQHRRRRSAAGRRRATGSSSSSRCPPSARGLRSSLPRAASLLMRQAGVSQLAQHQRRGLEDVPPGVAAELVAAGADQPLPPSVLLPGLP